MEARALEKAALESEGYGIMGVGDDIASASFKGPLKGQEIQLPNVYTEKITYTKRNPSDASALRYQFDKDIRGDFLKDFANKNTVNDLQRMGFSDVDIARMSDGLVPQGYQVHHKLPLDDGGTNDFSNLIIFKNDPYHKAITNYQNNLIRGMKPGETIEVEWPIPSGSYYNGG